MPAYILAQVEVTDPEKYTGYQALTPGAVAAGGGRFVVRGGPVEALEETHDGRRIVLLEFPDAATARRFYESPAYREARAARAGAARMTMLLLEGVG